MRVVIIGGSGHVGTYLVPRLVAAEYEVINIARAQREPYQPHGAWRAVQQVAADREAEDSQGVFGQRVRELEPDIVIDMICFTLESAQQMAEHRPEQGQRLRRAARRGGLPGRPARSRAGRPRVRATPPPRSRPRLSRTGTARKGEPS